MPAFLPGHPRTRSAVLWGLFALTCLALVVMVVVTLLAQLDPAGQGTPGTAVITRCTGQNTNKQCFGSFRSAEGTVQVADTRIFGQDFAHVGQSVTAYYDAGDKSVDSVSSGEDLSTNLVVLAWLLALALLQFWFRIMAPRRQRRLECRYNLRVDQRQG